MFAMVLIISKDNRYSIWNPGVPKNSFQFSILYVIFVTSVYLMILTDKNAIHSTRLAITVMTMFIIMELIIMIQ